MSKLESVKKRQGTATWRPLELEICALVAPGVGSLHFRLSRTMPEAGLVCSLRTASFLGDGYWVTSVTVGGEEVLDGPVSAEAFATLGNVPPWMMEVKRGTEIVVFVWRVRGSGSFSGKILCATRGGGRA